MTDEFPAEITVGPKQFTAALRRDGRLLLGAKQRLVHYNNGRKLYSPTGLLAHLDGRRVVKVADNEWAFDFASHFEPPMIRHGVIPVQCLPHWLTWMMRDDIEKLYDSAVPPGELADIIDEWMAIKTPRRVPSRDQKECVA